MNFIASYSLIIFSISLFFFIGKVFSKILPTNYKFNISSSIILGYSLFILISYFFYFTLKIDTIFLILFFFLLFFYFFFNLKNKKK